MPIDPMLVTKTAFKLTIASYILIKIKYKHLIRVILVQKIFEKKVLTDCASTTTSGKLFHTLDDLVKNVQVVVCGLNSLKLCPIVHDKEMEKQSENLSSISL